MELSQQLIPIEEIEHKDGDDFFHFCKSRQCHVRDNGNISMDTKLSQYLNERTTKNIEILQSNPLYPASIYQI